MKKRNKRSKREIDSQLLNLLVESKLTSANRNVRKPKKLNASRVNQFYPSPLN